MKRLIFCLVLVIELQASMAWGENKRRIIGSIIGTGIGGKIGYALYSATGNEKKNEKGHPLWIIIPTIVGGVSGYAVGTYYDGITVKEKLNLEQPKEFPLKGRIIGTAVGLGVGEGVGYIACIRAIIWSSFEKETGGKSISGSTLLGLFLFPTITGGTIGYVIGKFYDVGKYYLDLEKEVRK